MKKYTKRQRTKIANALHRCKRSLWDGKSLRVSNDQIAEIFICYALKKQAREGEISWESCGLAEQEVMGRLQDCTRLDIWLRFEAGVSWADLQDAPRMQAHRLAWVNLMIKEFES